MNEKYLDSIKAIEKLIQLRNWETEFLPFPNDGVEYAVFLNLVQNVFLKKTTLKEIYNSFTYSESTIRLTIRYFEQIGLIELIEDSDRRFRQILISDYGLEMVKTWSEKIIEIFII